MFSSFLFRENTGELEKKNKKGEGDIIITKKEKLAARKIPKDLGTHRAGKRNTEDINRVEAYNICSCGMTGFFSSSIIHSHPTRLSQNGFKLNQKQQQTNKIFI